MLIIIVKLATSCNTILIINSRIHCIHWN